jgi:hypothetical protein
LAQQAAARRVARTARLVQLSGRPHSEALSVRRHAVVRSSCCRRVEGRPLAVLSVPVGWQTPAAA